MGMNLSYRKPDYEFTTFHNDIEKILTDKGFVLSLLKYLRINFKRIDSFVNLRKIIIEHNDEYQILPTPEYLKNVRNTQDPFLGKDLKDIPEKRIVLVEEIDGTYNGFDVMALRKYLFDKKKNEYINPLTTNKICEHDMMKLLYANVRQLNYFMEE